MSGKTIIATGADGQLGRHLRLSCAGSADRWIFVGRDDLDITDPRAIARLMDDTEASAVVNCAAYTDVEGAESHRDYAMSVNGTAPGYLAEACRERGAFLVHISTDYVFDGMSCRPYAEDHPTSPVNAYGVAKLAGERAVAESGCRYVVLRTSWLYSLFGRNFVKTVLERTARCDSMEVVYDQVGCPTYAGDLSEAIFCIVENRLYEGNEGIYHYSGEGVCSWFDLARQTAELAGHRGFTIEACRSDRFPTKARRPSFSVLDKSKFKDRFGIEIPYWRDSLAVCVKYLVNERVPVEGE